MDKNYMVTKSNILVCGNTDLSVTEQKLILTLASMVQPQDDDFKIYNFNIKEFSKLLGIKGSSKYTELRATTKELKKKVIEVWEGDNLRQLSWLGGVLYRSHEGVIEISLDVGLKPYLIKLQSCYTTYRLANILQIKSKYSIRLFEILKSKQWGKKAIIIEIEDLKTMMCITEPSYKIYQNFKNRVIITAQKELKLLTEISFTFDELKTGRKVTALHFTISKNKDWQKSEAGEDFDQFDLFDAEDIFKIKGDAEDENN